MSPWRKPCHGVPCAEWHRSVACEVPSEVKVAIWDFHLRTGSLKWTSHCNSGKDACYDREVYHVFSRAPQHLKSSEPHRKMDLSETKMLRTRDEQSHDLRVLFTQFQQKDDERPTIFGVKATDQTENISAKRWYLYRSTGRKRHAYHGNSYIGGRYFPYRNITVLFQGTSRAIFRTRCHHGQGGTAR